MEPAHAAEVRDHWWWRPGWREGRRGYAWHLTFAGQDGLHRLARDLQAALAGRPEIGPVPVGWLHLTLQDVGFVEDVPPGELARMVEAVRSRLAALPAPGLTFGAPVVFPESVVVRPEPAGPVHAIRAAVRAGMAAAGCRVPGPDGFSAHVSVGYVTHSGPAEPLVRALRPVEPATVPVRAVSLIEMHRDRRVYEWRIVEDLPLGG